MASFLKVTRKDGLERLDRYYVGGCRVTRQAFNSLGTGPKSAFQTVDGGHTWKHYYEQAL